MLGRLRLANNQQPTSSSESSDEGFNGVDELANSASIAAREVHDVVTAMVRFDSTTRTIIDGRTAGFCKLIVDRQTYKILGCHVVGERAVEITQVAAIAIAGGMRVDDLAKVPLSFPTYAGILGRVAAKATRELNLEVDWLVNEIEDS